jgi:hypothetical protein
MLMPLKAFGVTVCHGSITFPTDPTSQGTKKTGGRSNLRCQGTIRQTRKSVISVVRSVRVYTRTDNSPREVAPMTSDGLRHKIEQLVNVDESGCWIWQGPKDVSHGYGNIFLNKKKVPIHRLTYELWVGKIPEGLQIDHLCRVRICCNPMHLEPVTIRENTLRGKTLAARHAAKTHCDNEHELAGDNLYIQPGNGQRVCKACKREANRRRNAKRKGK